MTVEQPGGDAARKVPRHLEAVRERFETWRKSRPTRACPIPRELWAAAARCARQYGCYRTALFLGLDSGKLKRQADGGAPRPRKRAPGFVELVAASPGLSQECVLEVETGAGSRLKMYLRGASPADLAELARSFAGGRA